MTRNKLAILVLTLLIVLSGSISPSLATGYSSAELRKEIEREYGFTFNLPGEHFNGASEGDLVFFYKDLKDGLDSLNRELVKELTNHYKNRGIKTVFKINIPMWSVGDSGYFSLNNNTATIEMLNSLPQARTNMDRHTLSHEVGHMLHIALDHKLGSGNIKAAWDKINSKASDKSKAYVSDYAQTSYREDFAETFAWMTLRQRQDMLLQIMVDEPNSIILEKVNYIDSIISQAFKSYKGLKTFNFSKPQKPSAWAKDDINRIIEEGKLKEPFIHKYQANINRAEFSELLIRGIYNEYSHLEDLEDYSDITFSSDYFDDITAYSSDLKQSEAYAINKLKSLDLINGKSEKYFDPTGLITRQEIAVIIKNVMTYLNGEEDVQINLGFTDNNKIASWANDAVGYVYSNEIMTGVENGKFEPLGFFTFEQAYITIDRLFK